MAHGPGSPTAGLRRLPGSPTPLGATWDGAGVNFAVFSEHATGVDLCLFDRPDGAAEAVRLPLSERTDFVWHGYVPGLGPGQLYGYRVHGAWAPVAGDQFNPAKVLLNPYARVVGRQLRQHPSLFQSVAGPGGADNLDAADSASYAPLGAVVDDRFDWSDDRRPGTPWSETVIYEAHVKGFTAAHPDVPPELRGTYLGLASPPATDHLRRLGVTAVELLPVHQHADEFPLASRGLTNYWGYNTLAYFAPDRRFAVSPDPLDAVREFKAMVKALHEAGLEVLLDVVFNHTAEGGSGGPALSMRGLDNRRYYRLDPARPWIYEDFSGCGNTLNTASPRVMHLVLDSLRYWAAEMHVDGFRFDLAPALARGSAGVDRIDAVFGAIAADPILSRVKLIAEPWDAAAHGMQLGGFPPGWSEWNSRFRDTARRFWRGDPGLLPELATRVSGSSDLFSFPGRGPLASVNFVTAHDGFTLADLVAYAEKHNQANGEDNRDGESVNFSWNSGVEGPSDDPAVVLLRERQQRNLLLTLFVSLGVPMVSGGDEAGRSQLGNNNAYCHDSPLTWTPWPAPGAGFVESLAILRRSYTAWRRSTFFADGPRDEVDVRWFGPDGSEMTAAAWQEAGRQTLGALFVDEALLVLFNASPASVAFVLPAPQVPGPGWRVLVDTSAPDAPPGPAGAVYVLGDRTAAVLTSGHGG